LEIANPQTHLDASGFADALSALPANEQIIVATTGIHFQTVGTALR